MAQPQSPTLDVLPLIKNQINEKLNIYQAIASKVNNISDEEARKVIDGELECYLTRLHAYIVANVDATLTLAQGCNIFLDVIQSGLSFSPVANHVYVSRLKGTGTAIGYKVTADGAIYQAQRAGAINHLSEPVLVLRGEQFSITTTPDGRHVAQHVISFDRRPQFNLELFMVGYVYVVYPDGARELHWISAERMKELRAKSRNPAMYNDESFIQTKIIKHALRKVRKTPFFNQSQIEAEEEINTAREFEPLQPPVPEQQSTVAYDPLAGMQQPQSFPQPPIQQQPQYRTF